MTFHVETRDRVHPRAPSDVWEHRLLSGATFLVMLVPTVLSRLGLMHGDDRADRGSIVHEARARADRILPFVFMG